MCSKKSIAINRGGNKSSASRREQRFVVRANGMHAAEGEQKGTYMEINSSFNKTQLPWTLRFASFCSSSQSAQCAPFIERNVLWTILLKSIPEMSRIYSLAWFDRAVQRFTIKRNKSKSRFRLRASSAGLSGRWWTEMSNRNKNRTTAIQWLQQTHFSN